MLRLIASRHDDDDDDDDDDVGLYRIQLKKYKNTRTQCKKYTHIDK